MDDDMTEEELNAKIAALGEIGDKERNSIVCALIGHSKIITTFFGYVSCARCEAQIGDALGGYFDGSKSVIVGHKCEQCEANFKNLSWRDTLYAPDPFAEEEEAEEVSAA